jgi:hypothetical protein
LKWRLGAVPVKVIRGQKSVLTLSARREWHDRTTTLPLARATGLPDAEWSAAEG